jgi:hypothetical protein
MKKLYILFFLIIFLKSNAQFTSIPDANFEQELIIQEIDTNLTPDGQVLTSAINTITSLTMNSTISNNIVNLTGVEGFTALQDLMISASSLQSINLSQNQNLKKLFLYSPQINILNLSNNIALETLYLYYANQLNTIDVSNNINLKDLRIGYFNLTQINLTNNINLEKLLITHTLINQLDITHNIVLKNIYLYNNFMTNIDLSHNLLLEDLLIHASPIISIDVSQNLFLKKISLYYTYIQNIDVSNNQIMEVLFSGNNLNTTLNLSNNPLLNVLNCKNLGSGGNAITNLIIQNGANSLLNGTYDIGSGSNPPTFKNRFDSTNNPNLHCIFVDDVANCNVNWLGKDAASNYVTTQQECNNLQNEEFISNSFTIYPNPVYDILFIENNDNNEIQKIVVYDLFGKAVIEQNGNSKQLNFSNISIGLYLVKITTENETVIKKIIKK